MDRYSLNGYNTELAQYETPFADVQEKEALHEHVPEESLYRNYIPEFESPFQRTYETAVMPTGISPQGEAFVDFLAELDDTEFVETLYELAAEAETSWTNKISNEAAMGENYLPFVTKLGREYFEPVVMEAEAMIDHAAEHFSANNLAAFSDSELDTYFSEYPFQHARFSPAQEQFLGGLWNKVKSVAKKGVELAKKGASVVGKLLPVNIVLNKLKVMVRPLLEKVLRYAIGKLPQNMQSHAQALAKKYLNLNDTPVASNVAVTPADRNVPVDNPSEQQPTEDVDAIQTELNTSLAQLVFAPNESEAETVTSDFETSFETIERFNNYETAGLHVPSLNEARQQFIDELKILSPGESPAPAIERFLPAAILALKPAIKMAIGLIGRQRVINFLAGILAKLVEKYVPANVAKPLATKIIDVGMSAIGFETYEMQRPDLAYEAIAYTIQETVQNMNSLNETVLGDQDALAMHLLEAFESAAANNFPAQYIREDLRPTNKPGTWVAMPRSGPAPYYKKFTHVYDVTIDPQTAASVKTFRGLPLANFLRDKMGLDLAKPIQAKVHLYEATKDTRLSRISKHENLPGLNANQPYAWVQLHPLTATASSLLLKEPAMGKEISKHRLKNRFKIHPGQRFYYLEINGARLRIPAVDHSKHRHAEGAAPSTSRPSQSGDVQAVVNFIKSEISLNYYFSEEDAKAVVEKLNRNDFLGVAQSIRDSVKQVLNEMLSQNVSSKVKIVHEAFPELYLEHYAERIEQFSVNDLGSLAGKEVMAKLMETLVQKVSDLAYQSLGNYFKARAAEFKAAQAEPQDGVTVKIQWKNVQGMSSIKAVISAVRGQGSLGSLANLTLPNLSAPDIRIVADKKFD